MAQFTYVTSCKGRLHHLARTLPAVAEQGGVDLVVCDYGCPDGTADWVRGRFPQVKVVRVADDPGFNLARARNLGAAAAETEWLAFFDADIMLAPDFFARVLPGLARGHYYLPGSSDPNTWGSCLVERSAFHAVGGYDEVIDGWGGQDNDLYAALSLHGIRRSFYPAELVTPIRHSDAERTRFFPNKNIDRATRLSHVYRTLKFDVIRHLSRGLDLDERRQLRAVATQMVEAAADAGTDPGGGMRRIVLPERPLKTRPPLPEPAGPRLRCWLTYEIAGYGTEQDPAAEGAMPDTDTAPGLEGR